MLFSRTALFLAVVCILPLLFFGNVFGYDYRRANTQDEIISLNGISPTSHFHRISILPPLYLPDLDFQDPLRLIFTPTLNTKRLNLTLSTDEVNDNRFRIQGTSSNFTAGFYSQPLNYRGENITIALGTVSKSIDRDFQLSFNFYVEGKKDNYTLTFVHGPLNIRGWDDKHYFERINSSSGLLVNLSEAVALHGDTYPALKKVIVAMAANSTLGPTDFTIE